MQGKTLAFCNKEKNRTKPGRKTLLSLGLKLLVALEGGGLFVFLDSAIASNHSYLNTNKEIQVFSQAKQFGQTQVLNISFKK